MNYKEFYKKATEELNSTFLYLNAKGDPSYKDHLEDMLHAEPLVRKPVFQTIFPWESYSQPMQQLSGLLGNDLINALDQAVEERFPHTRHPYKHQVQAWTEALVNNKSILVTTGTGSGKTECFMVPILKELFDSKCLALQNGTEVGIQAIFLYPLNALIASQRKRIHAWSSALRQPITYCNYNGELPHSADNAKRKAAYPEIIDRQSMRETPPQILFTNPSMLEYMMVRTADQNLKKNSDLKWIVLDEAHCYNGSSATELALQLQRVLRFFGKTPADVKFAITSATVSTNPAKQAQMHSFIEKLTGKLWADFVEIGGKRIVEQLDYSDVNTQTRIAGINVRFNLNLTPRIIDDLRDWLNRSPALTLDEIATHVGLDSNATTEVKLELVDALSSQDPSDQVRKLNNIVPPDTTAILPNRAHFNVRSVEGVYACTNPNCSKRNAYRPLAIGRLTTYKSVLCPDCGGKMLEVVRCSQCHELLLQGEKVRSQVLGTPDTYKLLEMEHFDDMLVEFEDNNTDIHGDVMLLDAQDRIATPPLPNNMIVTPMPTMHLDSMHGHILPAVNTGNYIECIKQNQCLCPKCGERMAEMKPIMLAPNMIQTHLARILLHQSTPATNITADMVYDGRKFISFTDNRQKTANTSRIQNVDVERSWIRGAIYHALVNHNQNGIGGNNATTLRGMIASVQCNPLFAGQVLQWQQQLSQLGKLNAQQITAQYVHDDQLKKLNGRFGWQIPSVDYLKALIFDQMGTRSLRTADSLETLGMVHWTYPTIESITHAPQSFVSFYGYSSITDPNAVKEWKNLLKVFMDVTIRGGHHVVIDDTLDSILSHSFASLPIYCNGANSTKVKLTTWPNFDRNADTSYRREFVLMLLAKGIFDRKAVTVNDELAINKIMKDAWDFLVNRSQILSPTGGLCNNFQGYGLDFFNANPKAVLELVTEGTMCPVTKQILDYTFMGLSPMLKGELCNETKARYETTSKPIAIPSPSFASTDPRFKNATGAFDKNLWSTEIEQWIQTMYRPAVSGAWGDTNSQNTIIRFDDIYISKEHSAQIDSKDLREAESLFIDGKLNVLNCSTTMEMGVDIGGLSVVTMNNVAPKPQNYQQRVGRAGRRGEQKALALTIYGDNPIGRAVETDPSWALDHEIEPSALSFASENIVYRHVCATLFAHYLSTSRITLKDQLGDFIMGVDLYGNTAPYSCQGYVSFLSDLRNGTHPNQAIISADCSDLVSSTSLGSATFNNLVDYAEKRIFDIYRLAHGFITTLQTQIGTATNKKFQAKLKITRDNFWEKNLFTYLGEKDYLPNAYMPTNVTELIIEQNSKRNIKPSNPQRETQLAINEYAPGRDIVVSEMVYKSCGIAMQSLNGNPIQEYVSICDCGYVTKQSLVGHSFSCPNCNGQLHPLFNGQANNATIGIEPIAFYAEPGTRHRSSSNRGYHTQPVLLDSQPWPNTSSGQAYFVRTPQGDSSVLYVNKGNGFGYALCPWCGRMEVETSIQNGGRNGLSGSLGKKTHARPDSGAACKNTNIQRNVVLTAEIKTNLTEIHINEHRQMASEEYMTLLHSLGTIMSRKYAEMLGIEDDEIGYGIVDTHTLFIFDTHCGGSCYSNRLSSQNLLERLFDLCNQHLSLCSCSKSCTNCLVDRKSQYNLDKLDRQLAIEWLNWEYSQRNIVPHKLQQMMPNATINRICTPIENCLSLLMQNGTFSWAKYFIDAHSVYSADIFGKIQHDMEVARLTLGKPISLLINEHTASNLSLQALCDLQSHKGLFDESTCRWNAMSGLYPILATDTELYVMYKDSAEEGYYQLSSYSHDFSISNENHFDPITQLAGRGTDSNRIDGSIYINEYLDKMLGKGIVNVTNYMDTNGYRNSLVDIEYTDIYVKSPAACITLCHVIKQFAERFNFKINKLTVYTTNQFRGSRCALLDEEFASAKDRDNYLSNCVGTLLHTKVNIVCGQLMPHDRTLLFKGVRNNLHFELEPNGGFANSWFLEDEYTHNVADINYPVDENFFMFNRKRGLGLKFTYAWK